MGDFVGALNITTVAMMALGVSGGLIVGAIPGLNATMAMALLTPMTYYLNDKAAIMLLCSVYVGALSGGLYSAVLLRIPGTSSSIATTFDGFPMARKGLAGRAIGSALLASFIGGTVSFLFLGFSAPVLSSFALRFGPAEYFAISLLGLSTVASVLGSSTLRGLISACLGLLLGTIGADVLVGTPRFDFGFLELSGGFNVLVILLGLFAIPQILNDLSTRSSLERFSDRLNLQFPSFRKIASYWKNYLRSALIGTWIGLLPGAGGSIASLLAYDQAKRFSRNPDDFGKGEEAGVIASETANNAVIGGSLIPLLTLGIPGDTPAAVLLSAFIIHGIQAGPMLYTDQPGVITVVLGSLYLSNILMITVALLGSRYIIRALNVPKDFLLPLIVVMCVVGAFVVNQRMFDVWVLVGIGLAGYVMEKYQFPVAPAVLGVILGPILESNLRRAIQISDSGVVGILAEPIALVLILLVGVNIALPVVRAVRHAGGLREMWKATFHRPARSGAPGIVGRVVQGLRYPDAIAGVGCMALGGAVFGGSYTLPTLAMESEVYGPGYYPRILAVATFVLGAMITLAPERSPGEKGTADIKVLTFSILNFIAYVALIDGIGFIAATLAYLCSSYFLVPGFQRESVARKMVTAVVYPVIVYFAFDQFFEVVLPAGALFDTWF